MVGQDHALGDGEEERCVLLFGLAVFIVQLVCRNRGDVLGNQSTKPLEIYFIIMDSVFHPAELRLLLRKDAIKLLG